MYSLPSFERERSCGVKKGRISCNEGRVKHRVIKYMQEDGERNELYERSKQIEYS